MERVLHKISNLVYITPAIILLLMNVMNMLNVCLNACFLPLCMINNYVSVYVLLQCILFKYFMNAHAHGPSCSDG